MDRVQRLKLAQEMEREALAVATELKRNIDNPEVCNGIMAQYMKKIDNIQF